jgi:hypothetical protein
VKDLHGCERGLHGNARDVAQSVPQRQRWAQ